MIGFNTTVKHWVLKLCNLLLKERRAMTIIHRLFLFSSSVTYTAFESKLLVKTRESFSINFLGPSPSFVWSSSYFFWLTCIFSYSSSSWKGLDALKKIWPPRLTSSGTNNTGELSALFVGRAGEAAAVNTDEEQGGAVMIKTAARANFRRSVHANERWCMLWRFMKVVDGLWRWMMTYEGSWRWMMVYEGGWWP